MGLYFGSSYLTRAIVPLFPPESRRTLTLKCHQHMHRRGNPWQQYTNSFLLGVFLVSGDGL